MKKLVFLFLISSNVFAIENYSCLIKGVKHIMVIDNDKISLKNKLSDYDCHLQYENLPGTEQELKVLDCSGSFNRKFSYYFTQMDEETIVLSSGFVWGSSYQCKKVND